MVTFFSDQRNFFSGKPWPKTMSLWCFELGQSSSTLEKGRSSPRFISEISTTKRANPRGSRSYDSQVMLHYNLTWRKVLFEWRFSSDTNINDWWKLDWSLNFFHANIKRSISESIFRSKNLQFGSSAKTSRFTFGEWHGYPSSGKLIDARQKKTAQGRAKRNFSTDLSPANELIGEARNLILMQMIFFNSLRNRYIIERWKFLPKEFHSLSRRQCKTWRWATDWGSRSRKVGSWGRRGKQEVGSWSWVGLDIRKRRPNTWLEFPESLLIIINLIEFCF